MCRRRRSRVSQPFRHHLERLGFLCGQADCVRTETVVRERRRGVIGNHDSPLGVGGTGCAEAGASTSPATCSASGS
jgi:hypothetical protein